MYRNMSSVNLTKGIIITLIVIGLLLGIAVFNTELVNPFTALSNYQREHIETQRIKRQNEIDTDEYEALQDARIQAEEEQLRAETQHQEVVYAEKLKQLEEETAYLQRIHELAIQQQEAETKHQEQIYQRELQRLQDHANLKQQLLQTAGHIGIAVFGISMIALSIGVSIRIAKRVTANQDVWTEERKREGIELARKRERKQRLRAIEKKKQYDESDKTPAPNVHRRVADSTTNKLNQLMKYPRTPTEIHILENPDDDKPFAV